MNPPQNKIALRHLVQNVIHLVPILPIAIFVLSLTSINSAHGGTQGCSTSNWSAGVGYTAEAWNNPGTNGWACLYTNDANNFSIYWDLQSYGFVHRVGRYGINQRLSSLGSAWAWQTHTVVSWGNQGTVAVGMYGWGSDPKTEWYVIDDWLGQTRPQIQFGRNKMGELFVDGEWYEIYYRDQIPGTDFVQWISIRKNRRSSGTISLGRHFAEWLSYNVGGYRSDGTKNSDSLINQASCFAEPWSAPTSGKLNFWSRVELQ